MGIIRAIKLAYDYTRYTDNEEEGQTFRAVDGVDLDIEEGEFIAILGHNGSGKSTFAKHINALLLPTEGSITVDGINTKEEPELWRIRQKAGMVFQNPDNQIIATMVEDDVAFGPENLGIPKEEIWTRVEEALTKVGMIAYREKSPNRLSGGQKQRVAIAGIVAMRPKVIIFDEPTAMLDPVGRKDVLEAAWELNKQENVTVILITHYMEEVTRADRVFVMDGGHVAFSGTPREVFSRVEELRELRLDVPQVTELAHLLKNYGLPMPDGVLTRDEFRAAIREGGGLRKHLPENAEGASLLAFSETEASPRQIEERNASSAGEASTEEPDASGLQTSTETSQMSGTIDLNGNPSEETSSPAAMAAVRGAVENPAYMETAKRPVQLELSGVTFAYSKGTAYETRAIDGISLKIRKGEFVGIIGHTGSGKSTLIQHFNGLMRPTNGRVLFEGEDIWEKGYDLRRLRTRVGMVFQFPESQLFETDVLTDCAFGPKNQGYSPEEAKEKARAALYAVGVSEEFFDASPFELSGGQKRRVAIAGVLAMEPDILILDEPTAGLDPRGRDEILGRIRDFHDSKGITIVLVSHSMEDVAAYAERLVVVSHGKIAYDDTPAEVFSHYRELEKLGLAAPQITYLMHELREDGYDVDVRADTVEEACKSILSQQILCRVPKH